MTRVVTKNGGIAYIDVKDGEITVTCSPRALSPVAESAGTDADADPR